VKAAAVKSLLLLAAVATACGDPPGDVAAAGAAPAPFAVAVGPLPGPEEDAQFMANPFSADRAAAGEGRRLFVRFNCAGCHGEHGGGGMGPSLRDIDWLYGHADAQVYDSIAQGRSNGMPTWARRLSQDQIWRLVTYIKSLRTNNEPDPPMPS
jgi:cytochrome c oxidase cbb3-type subunit III